MTACPEDRRGYADRSAGPDNVAVLDPTVPSRSPRAAGLHRGPSARSGQHGLRSMDGRLGEPGRPAARPGRDPGRLPRRADRLLADGPADGHVAPGAGDALRPRAPADTGRPVG